LRLVGRRAAALSIRPNIGVRETFRRCLWKSLVRDARAMLVEPQACGSEEPPLGAKLSGEAQFRAQCENLSAGVLW
jgi:hypothetical protein